MFRAADAIDASGGAREIAKALYAELFGLKEKDGIRQSVLRYFHGRSSLATWLRSLIAQRFVDRHRETRRLEPLPEEGSAAPLHARAATSIRIGALRRRDARRAGGRDCGAGASDRLRLACYYAQEMTLAEIGTITRDTRQRCRAHSRGRARPSAKMSSAGYATIAVSRRPRSTSLSVDRR